MHIYVHVPVTLHV